jgi:hypothetical protein
MDVPLPIAFGTAGCILVIKVRFEESKTFIDLAGFKT